MGAVAGLHRNRARLAQLPEPLELRAAHPAPLLNATGALGDGNLEVILGQIHGDDYVLHYGSTRPGFPIQSATTGSFSGGRSPARHAEDAELFMISGASEVTAWSLGTPEAAVVRPNTPR